MAVQVASNLGGEVVLSHSNSSLVLPEIYLATFTAYRVSEEETVSLLCSLSFFCSLSQKRKLEEQRKKEGSN